MSGTKRLLLEIIELIEADKSVTEICNLLGVTPETVETVAEKYLGYIDDSEAP